MGDDEFYEKASTADLLRAMQTRERAQATEIPDEINLTHIARIIVNAFAEGQISGDEVEFATGLFGFGFGLDPQEDFEGCKALVAKIASMDLVARVVR